MKLLDGRVIAEVNHLLMSSGIILIVEYLVLN